MNTLTREQRDRREEQIPDLVRNIGRSNPAVANLIGRFVAGHIATLDEMLIQMVVALDTNWATMRDSYIEYQGMIARPIVIANSELGSCRFAGSRNP